MYRSARTRACAVLQDDASISRCRWRPPFHRALGAGAGRARAKRGAARPISAGNGRARSTAWWRARRARHARRRRHPQSRRQRGRRGGRGRLCARGHASARRQYRRRRLHAGASRRAATKRSRSTIARPRRPRRRAISFSTRRARPIRESRATQRSASACPARWRVLRSRTRNTARASSRSPQLIAPAISSRATASRSTTISPTRCRGRSRGSRAGRRRRKSFSSPTASALGRGDRLVQADLASLAGSDRGRRPARLLRRARSPKRSSRACASRRHHDRSTT